MDKNGTFRKRKVSFSQVSNAALRDKKLSLRAKGLYSIISSYITLDNFTLYKSYLLTLSIDGKDSFNRSWDELKANGYLVQYQTKGDGGKYLYEYELLDQPRTLTADEIILIKQKEKNRVDRNNRKVLNKKAKTAPQTEVPPMDENADSTDGDSTHGDSTIGDSVPIVSTDGNDTDLINTDTTEPVVIPPENVIALEIDRDTRLSLTDDQIKRVARWDAETTTRAIKIYNKLNGLYFKLLDKIYREGAIESLVAPKVNKFNDIIPSEKIDFDELQKIQDALIDEKLRAQA